MRGLLKENCREDSFVIFHLEIPERLLQGERRNEFPLILSKRIEINQHFQFGMQIEIIPHQLKFFFSF